MNEQNIEFKILEAKLIGSNVIRFRIEDGALIKITIDLDRIGKAEQKNPDGTNMYNFNISTKVNVIQPDKKFFAPKPPIQQQPKDSVMKPI